MNHSSTQPQQQQQQQKSSLLLNNQEAEMVDCNDKLLLPSSTRSIKRRTSLLEKSRDWARRLITLHRPRRNTTSNEKIREVCSELLPLKPSSHEKNFDEDGYLSPMEIKAHLDDRSQENPTAPLKVSAHSSHPSPRIYRYHDPNLPPMKRYPTTSFVSEFQKSLSIVDYIDTDLSDEVPLEDDPLESIKHLFSSSSNTSSRRLPRRPTNISSASTDSGYSDMPTTSKIIPVQILPCSLIPVNVHCLTCTCRPSSTTCLINQSHAQLNHLRNGCGRNRSIAQNSKSHSTLSIFPTRFHSEQKVWKNKRANLSRHPSITDDLIAISRWYKPYLEREAVHNVLQQADYGAFLLRNSSTHADCYALSIKVPRFTHDSNIVHYLIEKNMLNDRPSYRIKGTLKEFPTLLALLTHHSVMPEILPITLNFNESFTV